MGSTVRPDDAFGDAHVLDELAVVVFRRLLRAFLPRLVDRAGLLRQLRLVVDHWSRLSEGVVARLVDSVLGRRGWLFLLPGAVRPPEQAVFWLQVLLGELRRPAGSHRLVLRPGQVPAGGFGHPAAL